MKIFKDLFNEDELCSDTYPNKVVDDVIMELEGKFITETEGDYDIGANPSAEGAEGDEGFEKSATRVINIVSAHQLVETGYSKKDYLAYIKMYMKKVKAKLEEAGDTERVALFQKGAETFVKKVLGKFDDYTFYYGSSMDPEAMVVLMYYGEDGQTPHFCFWLDGMKGEKV